MSDVDLEYLRENIKNAIEAAREQERKITEHLNALERIDEYLDEWSLDEEKTKQKESEEKDG